MTTEEQEALDAAARQVQGVQHDLGRALPLVQRLIEGRYDYQEQERMSKHLADAFRGAEAAQETLVRGLGATSPGLRVGRDSLRLDQLSTDASRTLLAMLQECLLLAQELDRERGWVDEQGECIGWTETIGAWELGLRREVEGAKGSGRE